ncbi:hypothetical protein ACH5RR_036766 [Cinchona calisaya]|uniref:Uncharacterized protein n=1 Tax=Cinchona calisaya TaxID=153742 RepID=A0ABD2Y452_9GENT
MKLREIAKPFIIQQIGNGFQTNFWYDNWHPMGPLHQHFSENLLTNFESAKKIPWLALSVDVVGHGPQEEDLQLNWDDVLRWMVEHWKTNTLAGKFKKLFFSITVYHLWHARNDMVFANKVTIPEEIVKQITDSTRLAVSTWVEFREADKIGN